MRSSNKRGASESGVTVVELTLKLSIFSMVFLAIGNAGDTANGVYWQISSAFQGQALALLEPGSRDQESGKDGGAHSQGGGSTESTYGDGDPTGGQGGAR